MKFCKTHRKASILSGVSYLTKLGLQLYEKIETPAQVFSYEI